MDKKTVIDHFGNVRKTALAFNVSTQAVYAWPNKIPELIALKAERLTEGYLKYNEKDYALDP